MLTKLILLGISFLALFQLQEALKKALKTDIIIPSQRDHINSMFKKLENAPIIKFILTHISFFLICNFVKNPKILNFS